MTRKGIAAYHNMPNDLLKKTILLQHGVKVEVSV